MKIVVEPAEGHRVLLGYAEIPEECGDIFTVKLFGSIQTKYVEFQKKPIAPKDGGSSGAFSEYVLVAGSLGDAEMLPGWRPIITYE